MMKGDPDSHFFIRLRGLPYSAEEAEIRTFFGEELTLLGVHFINNNEGKPSGEAYVQLASEAEIEKAVEKHQNLIGNRYIEVFTVGDVEIQQVLRRIEMKQAASDFGTIRVRGLPFSCKKDDITNFFKGMNVLEVVFGKEPGEWGRPTGEAYVRFGTIQEAERAMQLNGQYLGRRYLELFRVDGDAYQTFKDHMENGGGRVKSLAQVMEDQWNNYYPPGAYGGGYNYDPYAYGRGAPAMPPPGAYRSQAAGYAAPYGGRGGYDYPPQGGGYGSHYDPYGVGPSENMTPTKVHMRGLPYRVTAQQIQEFFSPITCIDIKTGVFEDGRASGDGIVEFATPQDANEALSRDRNSIRNRYIELFPHDNCKIPIGTTYKSICSSDFKSAAPLASQQQIPPIAPPSSGGGYGSSGYGSSAAGYGAPAGGGYGGASAAGGYGAPPAAAGGYGSSWRRPAY